MYELLHLIMRTSSKGLNTMILRILVILIFGVVSFVIGAWVGNLILPGGSLLGLILGAVLGAAIFGGSILYITRNIGQPRA